MGRRLKYEDVKNFIENESESGCKLLSEEYKNNTSKLKIECKCGEVFTPTLKAFKAMGVRQCRNCSNNKLKRIFTLSRKQ